MDADSFAVNACGEATSVALEFCCSPEAGYGALKYVHCSNHRAGTFSMLPAHES